jgi:hypothetical protein
MQGRLRKDVVKGFLFPEKNGKTASPLESALMKDFRNTDNQHAVLAIPI